MSSVSYANQKAVTDTGEEVILYSNGTWQYTNNLNHETNEITTNPKTFTKPIDSTFLFTNVRLTFK